MKLDHFKNLTEDEQEKLLQGWEAQETTIKDNEAEINSLKKENETYKTGSEKLEKELKETKEMNFTLARQIDTSKNRPGFDDIMHDLYYKKGEKKT